MYNEGKTLPVRVSLGLWVMDIIHFSLVALSAFYAVWPIPIDRNPCANVWDTRSRSRGHNNVGRNDRVPLTEKDFGSGKQRAPNNRRVQVEQEPPVRWMVPYSPRSFTNWRFGASLPPFITV